MTEREFVIYNSAWLPTPYNHRFFVEKFASGFTAHGYTVRMVSHPKQIRSADFVMISNHDFSQRNLVLRRATKAGFFSPFRRQLQALQLRELRKIAECLKRDSVVLAWFGQNRQEEFDRLGFRYLLTGEYYYGEVQAPSALQWRDAYKSNENAIPIQFASAIEPNLALNLEKDIDVLFIGHRSYRPEWRAAMSNISNANVKLIGTPPFISEGERRSLYMRSKVILGLHSVDNVKHGVVVERVYEGLASGAVVVTDSPWAPIATDGAAIYADSPHGAVQRIESILADTELRNEIVKLGIEFINRNGTYRHRAAIFLDARRNLISS